MGGTEKKSRQRGRRLDVQNEERSIEERKTQRWTGGSRIEKRSKEGGGRRKRRAYLGERQQAALHHVSLHRDVFFYTLNDDTHQSGADSCIKAAANMQRPAV